MTGRLRQLSDWHEAPLPAAMETADRINDAAERMIAIQMAGYPSGWTDLERREMAEQHLFGRV